MAGKAEYTAEEWATLRVALTAGAELVSLSDGRSTMVREMKGVAKALRAATGHPSQLVRELAAEQPRGAVIAQRMSPREAEDPVAEVLRAAVAVLAGKTPDELAAYQQVVISLAEVAAQATREGGMFGIGGLRVSYTEAAAIDKVRQALGVGGG